MTAAYRVDAHLPKHSAVRKGMKENSWGLPPPSESNGCVRTPSRPSTQATTAEYAACAMSGPAITSLALTALWRRQGKDYRKIPEPPPSSQRPQSCFSRGSRDSGRSLTNGTMPSSMDNLEKRCDQLLQGLVQDGADHWGMAQERQARLCDENRGLTRHSAKVRAETQQTLDALRAEGLEARKSAMTVTASAGWPNPIVSSTPIVYQSAYDRFYGQRESPHLAVAKQRAKSVMGFEKYAGLTQWGADISLEMRR
eukprot:TRINITY_DN68670_c0_g1_i1.p1 TRINITY_DN68670_c0_g1~~TRINITY_DN68670_c0_g1_i1.p1  ORF type:complete len:254 (-),score=26.20 TRINITY_DN68670_c0_g1_i1:440-1201(-)